MANKSSGGMLGGLLLLVIAAVASIPKEVWIGIAVVGGVGLIAYLILKKKSTHQPPALSTSSPSDTGNSIRISVRLGSDFDEEPDPKVTSAQCWIGPGQAATVGGLAVPGGLLYVGSRLPAVRGYGIEPALIDPKLPVRRVGAAPVMPYWPSYSQIAPEARGEYLDWLAGGRRGPVQIGCVFLFLYGLERRVLHDSATMHDTVVAELEAINNEVEQLLSIYDGNNSFRNYASEFLELLNWQTRTKEKLYKSSAPAPAGYRRLRFVHKLALGQAAQDGVGLPTGWAYSWLMHDEMTYLRKPAERCPEEFRRLFSALYNQRFPQGMRLPVNKTRLKLSYRPASASFGGQIEFETGSLPDVTVLERPIGALRELATEATEALNPYSRYIARHPDQKNTMDAIALLPPLLWPKENLLSLGTWLRRLGVEHEMQAAGLAELIQHFPSWGAMNKDRAAAFASALELFGVGMEPDVRWGSPMPSDSAPVVLFSIPQDERGKQPSAVYAASSLTMHLAAAVSGADGLSPEEEQHLESSVEQMLHLQAHERTRLRAHLKWLLLSKPTLTALKKRVAALDMAQRAAIGAFVVNVAHVEGGLHPEEMKILAKVYRLLGLPEETLYGEAHAAATEPVTVRPGEKAVKRFKVPPKPAPAPAGAATALDVERIARLKAESAQVSALLGEIFAETEHAEEPPEPEEAPLAETTLVGLDVEHSHLAKVLMSRDRWSRSELEDLAADIGVMLDGALERVNEAFADAYGALLVEGQDPVEINTHVLKELESA
jgi:tellurite resistance protein